MNIERVRLRRAVHFVDGRLRAEEGAIGIVIGDQHDLLTIHFDNTEHFVEPDSNGQRIVPHISRLAVEAQASATMAACGGAAA